MFGSNVTWRNQNMSLKVNVAVFFSVFVILCCILTLGQFVLFLSCHKHLQLSPAHIGYFERVELRIALDLFLVALFALQHSLQSSKGVKYELSRQGYNHFDRLLYNLGSCLSLQVLMRFWHPISSWVVWEAPSTAALWWFFTIIHCIAWLLIYSGCYIMDLTEMLGVKQVVYAIQECPEPLHLKSDCLQRFYAHMRHPGFSALFVILIIHPVVQLDRLLLAHGLLAYSLLRTQVDDVDYSYQRRLVQRKERDLNFNE